MVTQFHMPQPLDIGIPISNGTEYKNAVKSTLSRPSLLSPRSHRRLLSLPPHIRRDHFNHPEIGLNPTRANDRAAESIAGELINEWHANRAARMAGFNAKKAPQKPIIYNGKKITCEKFRGIWDIAHNTETGETTRRPLNCARSYCEVHGAANTSRLRLRMVNGYNIEHRNRTRPIKLLTLTFQARRYTHKESQTLETWQHFMQRNNIADIPRLPKDYAQYSAQKKAKFIRQHNPPDQILLRSQQSPQEWASYTHGAFSLLKKAWEKAFGPMTYLFVWELTRQGTPHIHVAYELPEGQSVHSIKKWAARQWQLVLNTDFLPSVDAGRDDISDASNAVGYIISYMTKAGDTKYRGKRYNAGRYALTGNPDHLAADWETKIRRYSRSKDWGDAIARPRSSFTDKATGEIINLHDRKKAYGRWYYHAVTKGRPALNEAVEWAAYKTIEPITQHFIRPLQDGETITPPPENTHIFAQARDGALHPVLAGIAWL